jgi:curli production assembly/transport component CsgG
VFKFVNVKDLLELEVGMTRNEPTQLCVNEAIEAAVAHLIVLGIQDGNWALQDPAAAGSPVVQRYLANQDTRYRIAQSALADDGQLRAAVPARPAGAP